jgi:hypothetical protein
LRLSENETKRNETFYSSGVRLDSTCLVRMY